MKSILVSFLRLAGVALCFSSSCGNPGEEIGGDFLGSFSNVSGSITSQSGSQEEMAGWVVALIEKDSQIAKLAEIDTSGSFNFSHVFVGLEHTIALLSPSLVLRAVLAHPSEDGTSVRQYFKFTSRASIPRLIHKGLVLSWQETSNIQVTGQSVPDVDADGIPEGVLRALTASETSLRLSSQDTDVDGTPNTEDPDIDGDGLINLFDHNVDGDLNANGTPLFNEFDTDTNGDLVPDLRQNLSSSYFDRGADWVILKYDLVPSTTNPSEYVRQLTFVAKIDETFPERLQSVQIRRVPSLPILDEATVDQLDTDGNFIPLTWDGFLLDDGLSEDGAANDGMYARKVSLRVGSVPTTNQVFSFQLQYPGWTQEFLYIFPPIRPLGPTPSYSAIDRSITFNTGADAPFGNSIDFVWIVIVFEVQEDNSNKTIYTSQPVNGIETSFILPDNVIETGKVYRYKVIAQTQEKVPGYASFKIESPINDVQ
ncbi:MAG: hypothetical protein HRU09_09595 [Oligoflexales bacterium]|nr:hypothetical protein [Oligoflexales bacterium]